MSKDLRWRIIALQVVVIVIFAFGAVIGAWAHNFTHDQVVNLHNRGGREVCC
jgi:hypothetical protein